MLCLLKMAFSLELISLGVGTFLFVWSLRNGGAGKLLSGVVGFIIIFASVLSLGCTTYYSVRYWDEGNLGWPKSSIQTVVHKIMPAKAPAPKNS